MDKHIILLLGALAAPAVARADTGVPGMTGNGIRAPHEVSATGSGAYFGLRGQDDLFARLRDKVIEYWTPNFSGFDARISYATDSDARNSAMQSSVNSDKFAFSLNYRYREISAFIENDKSWGYDSSGLSHSSTGVGARYEFAPGTRFGLGYRQHSYGYIAGNGAPLAGNARVDDWYVSLVRDVGTGGHIRLSFSLMDNSGAMANQTGAMSLGYGQALSDRTEIYALYTRSRGTLGLDTGANPNEFGLGLKYNF